MELLGIGPLEVLAIVLIIIVLFPAKEIGATAKKAGRMLRDLYRSETWRVMRSTSEQIQHLPATLAREAELEELRDWNREIHEATSVAPLPDASTDLSPTSQRDPSEKNESK